MAECFMCSDDGNRNRVVTVSVWDDRKEPIDVPTTCPRCHGTGRITDGFTRNEVIKTGRRKQPEPTREAVCICNYKKDGPLGHPQCPAR